MIKRGRRSATALSIVPIGTASRPRLQPPSHLTAKEAAIFVAIVAQAPVDHFVANDVYLLASFAQVTLLCRETAKKLPKDMKDKLAQMKILEQQLKLQTLLATKLRIAPSSRLNPHAAGRKASNSRPSVLEGMDLSDD